MADEEDELQGVIDALDAHLREYMRRVGLAFGESVRATGRAAHPRRGHAELTAFVAVEGERLLQILDEPDLDDDVVDQIVKGIRLGGVAPVTAVLIRRFAADPDPHRRYHAVFCATDAEHFLTFTEEFRAWCHDEAPVVRMFAVRGVSAYAAFWPDARRVLLGVARSETNEDIADRARDALRWEWPLDEEVRRLDGREG